MAKNVLGFTGPRKAPTPQDVENMVRKIEEIADLVRSGEVVGIAYALVREDGYTSGSFRHPGVHPALITAAAFGLALDATSKETGGNGGAG